MTNHQSINSICHQWTHHQRQPHRCKFHFSNQIHHHPCIYQLCNPGTELSGLDNISPFSKCRTVGRHAGDHHGSPFPNKVLCVDTSKHINLHKTLTVNSFLLNRYSSLTVFIWQNLSISASGHRKNMILTYFETISRVEFSQCDIKIFLAKILIS